MEHLAPTVRSVESVARMKCVTNKTDPVIADVRLDMCNLCVKVQYHHINIYIAQVSRYTSTQMRCCDRSVIKPAGLCLLFSQREKVQPL